MKKTALLPILFVATLFSCNGDFDAYELSVINEPALHFADQLEDSVDFYTTDSWTLTPQCDWITVVGDTYGKVHHDNGKRYRYHCPIQLKPNDTGHTRTGMLLLKSEDKVTYIPFVQLGVPEFSRPEYSVASYVGGLSSLPDSAYFVLTKNANSMEDSLVFVAHGWWQLTPADPAVSWVSADTYSGNRGRNKVMLTFQPNTDMSNERMARMTFTSGGVSSLITVRQLPAAVSAD